MAIRSIGSGTLSFGLVSIPFKLYNATRSGAVQFHQLHPLCGGRIQYKVYCPTCDEMVSRRELIKGYEYEKGRMVEFTGDELKALEAARTHELELVEFVPLETVDLIQVDKTYFIGPQKGAARAYRLLARAMRERGRVAVGRYMTRGREQLVVLRPYRDGLLLHQMHYAEEVLDFEEVDIGEETEPRPGEEELAQQLIDHLSGGAFDASRYRDTFRDRVLDAVEEKIAGKAIRDAGDAGATPIVDLFDALKASLAADANPDASADSDAPGDTKHEDASRESPNDVESHDD